MQMDAEWTHCQIPGKESKRKSPTNRESNMLPTAFGRSHWIRYYQIMDIARGLEYLHSEHVGIIHGDLKGVS